MISTIHYPKLLIMMYMAGDCSQTLARRDLSAIHERDNDLWYSIHEFYDYLDNDLKLLCNNIRVYL